MELRGAHRPIAAEQRETEHGETAVKHGAVVASGCPQSATTDWVLSSTLTARAARKQSATTPNGFVKTAAAWTARSSDRKANRDPCQISATAAANTKRATLGKAAGNCDSSGRTTTDAIAAKASTTVAIDGAATAVPGFETTTIWACALVKDGSNP